MKRLAFALALGLALAACGQPARPEIRNVWTRDTVGNTANAAVFMTIRSSTADRLVAASTPVARQTDLMTMKGGSNAMSMDYVEAIDIPANTPVYLDPAGLHVWLAGLNQPLKNGESFPLTLEFEKSGKREVRVAIIGPASPAPTSGM